MAAIPVPPTLAAPSWALVASPLPEVFPEITSGTGISDKVNMTSSLLEVLCRYALGGYCVLEGYVFTVSGASLTVTIGAGLAVIDGVVRNTVAYAYTSTPASQATVNIWLKQDGTFTHTLDATPPAGKVLYIGQVTTDGTGVTAHIYEGVVYAMGGSLWRTLTSAPTDTLDSASRIFTQVGADIYVWSGSAHKKITLT